jgi:hypothetical protein
VTASPKPRLAVVHERLPVINFVRGLQEGLNAADAGRFNQRFADDVVANAIEPAIEDAVARRYRRVIRTARRARSVRRTVARQGPSRAIWARSFSLRFLGAIVLNSREETRPDALV